MKKIKICQSSDLQEGGIGYRFKVLYNSEETTAFVLRIENSARGFLNRCSHLPVELDWNHGEFLDDSSQIIVCASHGASYDAKDGRCLGGPCNGSPLVRLNVGEENGGVYFIPSELIMVPPSGIEE
jgi:nitrite reductase/ring-hydroxylating ferredoxin subunit